MQKVFTMYSTVGIIFIDCDAYLGQVQYENCSTRELDRTLPYKYRNNPALPPNGWMNGYWRSEIERPFRHMVRHRTKLHTIHYPFKTGGKRTVQSSSQGRRFRGVELKHFRKRFGHG